MTKPFGIPIEKVSNVIPIMTLGVWEYESMQQKQMAAEFFISSDGNFD
jgi:hypothetical protein